MEFFAMLYAALSFLRKKTHHDHVHHVHCTVVHYGRHALEVAWLSRTGRGCVNFSCGLTDGRTNKGIPRGPQWGLLTDLKNILGCQNISNEQCITDGGNLFYILILQLSRRLRGCFLKAPRKEKVLRFIFSPLSSSIFPPIDWIIDLGDMSHNL